MAAVNSRHRANVKRESQPGSQVSLLWEQYTGDTGKSLLEARLVYCVNSILVTLESHTISRLSLHNEQKLNH